MWQDWTNFVIGLWLLGTPWILGTSAQESRGMIFSCVVSGLLIATFALWAAYSRSEEWQDWVLVLLCIWLFTAPGTLQYNVSQITWNNFIVSIAVGTFAFWSLAKRRQLV